MQHQVACQSVAPLVHRIKAAAHRDVSRIVFPELVQLFVEGARTASTASATLGSASLSSPTSASSPRMLHRTLFDEWCLRSVFASKWTEVDVDHVGFCDYQQVDASRPLAEAGGEGPTTLHQLSAWAYTPTSSSSAATAVERGCRAAASPPPPPPTKPLTIAWHASLFATNTGGGTVTAEGDAVAAAVVARQGGVRRLESLLEAIRTAPIVTDSGGGSGAAKPTPSPPVASTTVLVPFSTLMEVRQCAFHHQSGGAVDQKDSLSLHAALQLVRRVLSLQHHATMGGVPGASMRALPIRMVVVPPSAEIEALMAVRSLFPQPPRQSTNVEGQASSSSVTVPSMRLLCESSTVRWASFSRFASHLPAFAALVQPHAPMLLDVDGAAMKRQVMDLGGCVASRADVARSMPSMSSSARRGNGNGVHRSVVQQCSAVSKRLSVREQNLRASFAAR